MDAEFVRMRQKPTIVLKRRQIEDEVKREEGKEWNGRTNAASALHIHNQTWGKGVIELIIVELS